MRGNFTAQSNSYQAFRATGAHLTKFNGTTAQSIYFYYPADNLSRFQHVEFANSSTAGVTFASTVFAAGNAAQDGRLAVPSSLVITGALTLGPAYITNVTGTLSAGSCSFVTGAVFTGFRCP